MNTTALLVLLILAAVVGIGIAKNLRMKKNTSVATAAAAVDVPTQTPKPLRPPLAAVRVDVPTQAPKPLRPPVAAARVHCAALWSNWSECSNKGKCGQSGKKTRRFKITRQASNGGVPCAKKDGTTETLACPVKPCAAAPLLRSLSVEYTPTWLEAESIARENGGSLPTREELKKHGVTSGGRSVWHPVRKPTYDWVNIGMSRHCIQYCSHLRTYWKLPSWGSGRWNGSATDDARAGSSSWRFLYITSKPADDDT